MPRISIEEIDRAVADTNAPQMFLKLASEHPDQPVLHSLKSERARVVERVDAAATTPTPRHGPSPDCSKPVSSRTNASC